MELKVLSAGSRIDKYVSENTAYSREKIAKLVSSGQVLVNGLKVKPSYKVSLNDLITFDESSLMEVEVKPEEMKLDIVYEDDDVLVINKPSGLVVHPGSGNNEHTLVNGLLAYTSHLSDLNGPLRSGIVHRLDKDTSGLMLVCKTNRAHEILAEDFKTKKVHREYIALLEGVFPHSKASIEAPIGRDKNNFSQYTVTSEGKYAKTNLEVLEKFSQYTLVKLVLETGRTHQIRVHMAYIGYPVFNDPVYSKKKATSFGQFLHSASLEFIHPITKKKLIFHADLPKEFQEFLDNIKEDKEKNKIN